MERSDNERTATGHDDLPDAGGDKPVSFDFKLRLGSRETTTAQLSGRATGELVQLQPIDWDAFGGLRPDEEPRAYQSDGDLQSIIVELANRIAGPDSSSNPVLRVSPSATVVDEPPNRVAARLAAEVASVEVASVEVASVEVASVEVAVDLPAIVEQATLPSAELAQVNAPAAVFEAPVVPAAPSPAPAPPAPVMISHADAMASSAVTSAPVAQPAPAAPIAPLTLAKIERKPGAERPSKPVDFHSLLGQAGFQTAAVNRRKKRHPFRTLFKLVILLGIVGGGLFFGKTYVLDKRWDGELKPFAEDVAAERQLEWKKAIKIEVLPASKYAEQLAISWLGMTDVDVDAASAEWRAMGLAEGDVDLRAIGYGGLSARPVFYDPIVGKLYELEGAPDDLRDLALSGALTMALLDQHVAWSQTLLEAEPGERLAIRAMVDGDSTSTALAIVDPSEATNERLVDDEQRLAEEYQSDWTGAPRYAIDLIAATGASASLFDVTRDPSERDELLDGVVDNDASIYDAARGLNFRPTDLGGAPGQTRGLMYWYYALAGRLSTDDAWSAALAWTGDLVTVTDSGTGACVTATVATVDAAGHARLLDALQRWATTAPATSGTLVTAVGVDRIEVKSCDPGTLADSVLNDPIVAFGRAPIELDIAKQLEARTDGERECITNAVRGFNVVATIETGDQAQIDSVLASIGTACGV